MVVEAEEDEVVVVVVFGEQLRLSVVGGFVVCEPRFVQEPPKK